MTDRGDTQDIRPHHNQPADKKTLAALEVATQRRGRRQVAAGIGIIVGNIIISLVVAILADGGIFISIPGQLFGLLATVSLMIGGAALAIVGGVEWTHRPDRAQRRADADAIERLRIQITRSTLEHSDWHETTAGLVSTLPDRINSLEGALDRRLAALEGVIDTVPAYAEGVIHGVTMRQGSVDPEEDPSS